MQWDKFEDQADVQQQSVENQVDVRRQKDEDGADEKRWMEDEYGVAMAGEIQKFLRCSGRISQTENEICSGTDIFSTFFSEICRVRKINKW